MPYSPSNPKHPDVKVKLSSNDGNAFAIVARCQKAARRADVTDAELREFANEAMAGDYDHLLRTCMTWFDCS